MALGLQPRPAQGLKRYGRGCKPRPAQAWTPNDLMLESKALALDVKMKLIWKSGLKV